MENKISKALTKARKHADFIDLIQTNFTSISSGIDPALLSELSAKYFTNRNYQPDSKGLLKTREAISTIYQKEISPERILVTASTSESYSLIFNSLTTPDDEILLPLPGYPLFEYLCEYSHIKPKFYKLNKSENWQPDCNSIETLITAKTKAIVLISPNNPTGSIISQSKLDEILKLAEKYKLFVIFDEVFSDFVYPGNKFTRPETATTNVPVFFLNGISKMLALPDLKLAWIACSLGVNAESLELLEVANDTYLNAGYLIQDMFPELLKIKDQALAPIQKILGENWITLKTQQGKGIETILPTGGIHAIIALNITEIDEEKICLELLNKYKLSLHPGFFYDLYENKACFVISLLQNQENFRKALSILESYVIQCTSSK